VTRAAVDRHTDALGINFLIFLKITAPGWQTLSDSFREYQSEDLSPI
jgi:hypothetical protein